MIIDFNYQPILEDYKKNGEMKLSSILKILENSGNKHSDTAGDAILEGTSNGKAWVLTDWYIEILSYPKYGDKVLAKTWSELVKNPLVCTRDFELYCNGNLSVIGTTKWIQLDLERNRPCKIEAELIAKYQPEDKQTFADTKLPRIPVPEFYENEVKIMTRRADIDFNDHVHNLIYLDYALEALPKAIYCERAFTKLRISYKAAVKESEEIICRYAKEQNLHICNIFGTDGSLKTQVIFE